MRSEINLPIYIAFQLPTGKESAQKLFAENLTKMPIYGLS